jgi:membrane peptidoglycan carboxypeptidase
MAHVLAPSDAAAINRAMVQAVEGPLGQQFTTGAKVPGVTTAGKSGTAELGGRGEPHSWFIGFAPAEKPELIVGGIMEFAEHGTTVAPYVVRVLHRYLLGPDTTTSLKVKMLDEGIALDTAPRPVELDPDSAAARARADSVRRLDGR